VTLVHKTKKTVTVNETYNKKDGTKSVIQNQQQSPEDNHMND